MGSFSSHGGFRRYSALRTAAAAGGIGQAGRLDRTSCESSNRSATVCSDRTRFAHGRQSKACPSARYLHLPPLLPFLIRGDDDGDGEEVFGAACFGFDSGQRRKVEYAKVQRVGGNLGRVGQ